MESKDPFSKPYIKAGDLQSKMRELLEVDPDASSLDMADQIYDWFMDCDRHRQIEVLSYAISHLRPTVKRKIAPDAKANGKAAAHRLLQQAKAKWLMSLTYDQLSTVLEIGPALRAKMKPGQKVGDVWTVTKIVRLMK